MSTAANEIQTGQHTDLARKRSSRAELLASRIEGGATLLANFAEGLSDTEWHTPVSKTDSRTVGVIVYHVANMYPIEVQVAQAIAGGNAITDVTWEAVAQINGKHASEQGDVTKAAARELLRKNSSEAVARRGQFHGRAVGHRGTIFAELRRTYDGAVRRRGPRSAAQLASPGAHSRSLGQVGPGRRLADSTKRNYAMRAALRINAASAAPTRGPSMGMGA